MGCKNFVDISVRSNEKIKWRGGLERLDRWQHFLTEHVNPDVLYLARRSTFWPLCLWDHFRVRFCRSAAAGRLGPSAHDSTLPELQEGGLEVTT
jgi:hypothetical protein